MLAICCTNLSHLALIDIPKGAGNFFPNRDMLSLGFGEVTGGL
jgi:hypothetical protein